ncbi:L-threonylcarbamoyladenylate synthase [Gymnodinialimonas ceratoperidinii]|uniref:Threonylcarbamoyl-AMP synthase n=1 Tax=Gymnodinialimonas ceratoperidinii TaxID=2856823 RepID=A0A8F6TWQ1_9RHOB|nr:L-threonylcarbamoyladenylate synthase [Gymnodinialimonas ceratoperidinii]QXT40347.1 threonylcarbamoyl-AMP synthase [Gymnodinialimonas ceratoperidinii]
MPPLKVETLHDNVAGIARAVAILRDGGLLALPTETVYGLAADARNNTAVARIFEAKGRPTFNPLIVHVLSVEAAAELVDFSDTARTLAEAFWPGPMTLVLPSRGNVADLVSGGLDTLAVRVPAHSLARKVLAEFGGPIAAPSANPSGQISPTLAQHVLDGLEGRIDAVLDGGACGVGLESTILAPGPDGVRLLREGGISREAVEARVGPVVADLTPGRVEAPGQMERHYAPRTKVLLGGDAQAGEVTVGFGATPGELSLSEDGDLVDAAARLFAVLHGADALATSRGAPAIRVAAVPEVGLGRAINDRLRRAAT